MGIRSYAEFIGGGGWGVKFKQLKEFGSNNGSLQLSSIPGDPPEPLESGPEISIAQYVSPRCFLKHEVQDGGDNEAKEG